MPVVDGARSAPRKHLEQLPHPAVGHDLLVAKLLFVLHQDAVVQITADAVRVVMVALHHQIVAGDDDVLVVEHLPDVEARTDPSRRDAQLHAGRVLRVVLVGIANLHAGHLHKVGVCVVVCISHGVPAVLEEVVPALEGAVEIPLAPHDIAVKLDAQVLSAVVDDRRHLLQFPEVMLVPRHVCAQGKEAATLLQALHALELGRAGYPAVAHHAVETVLQEHLQPRLLLSGLLDAYHLRVDQLRVILVVDDNTPRQLLTAPSRLLAEEQLLPVALHRRQTERLVESHVIEYQHMRLSRTDAHAAPHLLQVLRERQRRPCQLYELHFGTVEALREDVHVHDDIHLPVPVVVHELLTLPDRCLRLDHAATDALGAVVLRDVLRMCLVDGVDDALLALGERRIALVEVRDALRTVQHQGHLLRLVVAVRGTLRQRAHLTEHNVIRADRHVFKVREPSLVDELRDALSLKQCVEQVREALTAHSARRSRQPEEPCLRPFVPQHFVRLSQSMMRLVDDDKRKVKNEKCSACA